MKLILGLGNIGAEYDKTRHNAGFWVLEKLAKKLKQDWRNSRQRHALYAKCAVNGEDILLAMPTTYMNLSGDAAAALTAYYKIKPQDILIIHDDMDLPCGAFAFAAGGKAAGHHGVESVYERFPAQKISRLRIGIGRSTTGEPGKSYVLKKPTVEQTELLNSAITKIISAVSDWIAEDIQTAMNNWNHNKKTA